MSPVVPARLNSEDGSEIDGRADPMRHGPARVRVLSFLARFGGPLILAALLILFSALEPDTFLTAANLRSIARANAVPGILAVGLVLILSADEFDFSIGSVLSASMVATAVLTGEYGWHWLIAAVVVLIAGALVGLVNGLLVSIVGINSFVVTLATGGIVSGFALLRTDGQTLFQGVPQSLKDIGRDEVIGVPLLLVCLLVLAGLAWYVMSQTPWGRRQTATGKGRNASALAGVAVRKQIVHGFIGSSVAASLAGVLQLARLGSAPPDIGLGFLLAAFAGAFLGSTMIKPGFFNVPGTVIAIFLIGVGVNGLLLIGISSFIEQIFSGVVLLAAVALSQLERLNRSRVSS